MKSKRDEIIQVVASVLHQYNRNIAEQAEYPYKKVEEDATELADYILNLEPEG